MPAETHVRVSGSWRKINKTHVKVSGTWQEVKEIWVKVSGVWQKVFQYLNAAITDQAITAGASGVASTGAYRLNSNGQAQAGDNGSYTNLETWLLAGTNADFECRATLNSGTLSSGSTGVWESLSSSREWTRSVAANGFAQTNITVEIRRAADSVVVDSAVIDISVDAT